MENISNLTILSPKAVLVVKEGKKERIHKHENKEKLCYCCDTLQSTKESIITLRVSNRGYGSDYDWCDFKVQLCPNCYSEERGKWFTETPVVVDKYCEQYQYEDNIANLIKAFPLENQEYVLNHMDDHVMKRQDWLDMENGLLPDYKYKEYGMYSPSEVQAYEERFPICQYSVNVVFNDGSGGYHCPFGASEGNTCQECITCECFEERVDKEPITFSSENFELFKDMIKGEVAKAKLKQKLDT